MSNRNYSKEHHLEDRYYLGFKEGFREGYKDGFKDGIKEVLKKTKCDNEEEKCKKHEDKDECKYQERDTRQGNLVDKMTVMQTSEELEKEKHEHDDNLEIESQGKVRVELRIIRNDDKKGMDQFAEADEEEKYEYRKGRKKNYDKDQKPQRYSTFDNFFS